MGSVLFAYFFVSECVFDVVVCAYIVAEDSTSMYECTGFSGSFGFEIK